MQFRLRHPLAPKSTSFPFSLIFFFFFFFFQDIGATSGPKDHKNNSIASAPGILGTTYLVVVAPLVVPAFSLRAGDPHVIRSDKAHAVRVVRVIIKAATVELRVFDNGHATTPAVAGAHSLRLSPD